MLDLNTIPPWKAWQKFAFRFFFLFLGFFLFNYEFVFIFLAFNHYEKIPQIYSVFQKPLFWIDKHFYHIGYDPAIHQDVPGDNHFGLVYYISAAILFLIIAVVWSMTDRRRANYLKLNYWFGVYIRYMTAAIMLGYGIDKLIPVQMPYPDVTELLRPYGGQDLFSVAWNFVGSSPGYERFAGSCEIIGSLLLVFRRTYVFGALFMCTILCNVIAINVFYNIGVKLYSFFTLIGVLFLLTPYINKLAQFFFQNRNVSLAEPKVEINASWVRYLMITVGIVLVGGTILVNIFGDRKTYLRQMSNRRNQRLYNVNWFVAKDTLKPLLTDTLRWNKFAFFARKSAVIYNMRDSASIYDYDRDSVKHIYRVHDDQDSLKWDELRYIYPEKNKLQFTGKWKGVDVKIMMEESPIDSMTLKKEQVVFLQD